MIEHNCYSTNNVDKSYVKFVSNLQSYFKQLFITQIKTIVVNRIICLITPSYKNWLSVYLI